MDLQGGVDLVGFDTTDIVQGQALRVGPVSLVKALTDFIQDGLKDVDNPDIRYCEGIAGQNRIVIDSISIRKNVPNDPSSGLGAKGTLTFTYHSGYSVDASLHFKSFRDSDTGSGFIRYRGKAGGDDWNDTRGAIRMMTRKLVKILS